MADKKISDFTEITSVGDNDWFEVETSGGNSRKVKKSNLGAGALILLEQHTASSSATLDFTTAISSTYDEYVIEIVGIVPATDGANLDMRMSTDGGSTYDSSGLYDFALYQVSTGTFAGAVNAGTSAAQGRITNAVSNGAGNSVGGNLRLFTPGSSSLYKNVVGQTATLKNDGTYYSTSVAGRYRSTTAVNAFRFLFSSGNIASGTIRVYGVTK